MRVRRAGPGERASRPPALTMTGPFPLRLSPGTQVVTRVEVRDEAGGLLRRAGTVGVVVDVVEDDPIRQRAEMTPHRWFTALKASKPARPSLIAPGEDREAWIDATRAGPLRSERGAPERPRIPQNPERACPPRTAARVRAARSGRDRASGPGTCRRGRSARVGRLRRPRLPRPG